MKANNEKRFTLKSWSTNELSQLQNYDNHKITYDGFNYIWECKLNNKWQKRSITLYDCPKRALSELHYSLSIFKKEYDRRQTYKRDTELKNEVAALQQAIDIGSNLELSAKDRAHAIKAILPKASNEYIATIAKVHSRTIRRIFNKK
jgi:hypothetical protein